MPYLPHQPQGYAVHSHFASQPGRHKLIIIIIIDTYFAFAFSAYQ